jgi:hypothetical protein
LRWLKRASDAAEQDGKHQRAIAILHAAGQLAAETRSSQSPNASSAPPSPRSSSAISLALVGMVRQLKGLTDSFEIERGRGHK